MHYNNKHHLSKQEKELLKKLTEEQQEFLDKLEHASQEFEIFSAQMEDMKGSVDTMDIEIKEKEPILNSAIVDAHNALSSVQKYFNNFAGLSADGEIISLSVEVNHALTSLEENFKSLVIDENKNQ
jgi:hypothetical protein